MTQNFAPGFSLVHKSSIQAQKSVTR